MAQAFTGAPCLAQCWPHSKITLKNPIPLCQISSFCLDREWRSQLFNSPMHVWDSSSPDFSPGHTQHRRSPSSAATTSTSPPVSSQLLQTCPQLTRTVPQSARHTSSCPAQTSRKAAPHAVTPSHAPEGPLSPPAAGEQDTGTGTVNWLCRGTQPTV